MDELTATDKLKMCVREKLDHSLESPSDFDYLVLKVKEVTHEDISATTLKRIFGYIPSTSAPRRSSLAILARYLGYSGWGDFLEQQEGGLSISENASQDNEKEAQDVLPANELDSEEKGKPIELELNDSEIQLSRRRKMAWWWKLAAFAVVQLVIIVVVWKISARQHETSSDSVFKDNGVELSEIIANQYDIQTKEAFMLALEQFLQQETWLKETIQKSRLERDSFVRDFPASRLRDLPREMYDMQNKEGFAYRLKYKMDWMGAFYDVDSAPYECAGVSAEDYQQHMNNIADLLNNGALGNKRAIKDNPLYKPLKYRLLSIYYPDSNYMPFWLDKEVEHFLDVFLPDSSVRALLTPENCIDDREILYNFKQAHPIMKEWDNFMFMDFVFMYFPKWSGKYNESHITAP